MRGRTRRVRSKPEDGSYPGVEIATLLVSQNGRAVLFRVTPDHSGLDPAAFDGFLGRALRYDLHVTAFTVPGT